MLITISVSQWHLPLSGERTQGRLAKKDGQACQNISVLFTSARQISEGLVKLQIGQLKASSQLYPNSSHTLSVLVSSDCHKNIPQTMGLKQEKFIFPQFRRLEIPRSIYSKGLLEGVLRHSHTGCFLPQPSWACRLWRIVELVDCRLVLPHYCDPPTLEGEAELKVSPKWQTFGSQKVTVLLLVIRWFRRDGCKIYGWGHL